MRFQTEVRVRYSAAQNEARRLIRKNETNGIVNELPALADVLKEEKTAGEVELGVYEIPVNQIVGIAADDEKEYYTSDFLPLPSVNSDFAEKWCDLYLKFLNDRDLSEPVRCYEYLGKFYVTDGKKRVSVAKVHGSMVIKAEIIRILPVMTDDPRIRSYYELVRTFEKTGVYQIAFSTPCNTDDFLTAMGYDPAHVWNESDRWGFKFHWYPFERALKLAYDGYLNITTADAVKVLMQKNTYSELKQLPIWTLAEMMQESWLELNKISNSDFEMKTVA